MNTLRTTLSIALLALLGLLSTRTASAQCQISILESSGSVTPATGTLKHRDTIRTGADGWVLMSTPGGAHTALGPRTIAAIETLFCDSARPIVRIRVVSGTGWVKGSPSIERIELASPQSMATVTTGSAQLYARVIDTTFEQVSERQAVEASGVIDTLDVLSYKIPWKGAATTIGVLDGDVLVLKFGGRGRGEPLSPGTEVLHGGNEEFMSSDPHPLNPIFGSDGRMIR